MKSSISYKSCLIRGESFQPQERWEVGSAVYLEASGHQKSGERFSIPSSSTHKTFPTESAADDFALQEAMKWIDKNSKLKSK